MNIKKMLFEMLEKDEKYNSILKSVKDENIRKQIELTINEFLSNTVDKIDQKLQSSEGAEILNEEINNDE